MPILPEVESSNLFPGVSRPASIPVWIILSAGLSLMEPPGLNHSALARTWTPGDRCEVNLLSGSRGVLPTADAKPAVLAYEIYISGSVFTVMVLFKIRRSTGMKKG